MQGCPTVCPKVCRKTKGKQSHTVTECGTACVFVQVDRSAAYIARQAAKSVVAAGLANRCLVQVSLTLRVCGPF